MLMDETLTVRNELSEIERIREILRPVLANRFFILKDQEVLNGWV